MQINPMGAIFWIAVLAWIAWKIKKYYDNQKFIKDVIRDAANTYSAMSSEQKRVADQREKNSIKLGSSSQQDPPDTTLKTVMIIIILMIIFGALLNLR